MSRSEFGILLAMVLLLVAMVSCNSSHDRFKDLCIEAGGITVEVKGKLQCFAFDVRERINIEGEE